MRWTDDLPALAAAAFVAVLAATAPSANAETETAPIVRTAAPAKPAAPPPSVPGAARVYADLPALATGAAQGSFHPRGGFEQPLSERLSWAVEGEFYHTAPGDDYFLQADILALAKLRPVPGGRFYFGAGVGPGWASSKAGKTKTVAFAGILCAEAGVTFRPFGGAVYLEPFVRPYAVFRPGFSAGADAGLRAGWVFDQRRDK
jgi:hypothetical protein